jgi:hypothetical protein
VYLNFRAKGCDSGNIESNLNFLKYCPQNGYRSVASFRSVYYMFTDVYRESGFEMFTDIYVKIEMLRSYGTLKHFKFQIRHNVKSVRGRGTN